MLVEPSKFYIIICTSTILSNIYIFNYYIYKCTYILYFKLHSFTLLKQSHSLIVLHSYLCIWLNCCGIISQVIIYLKVLKRWIWNLSVALFCSTLQAARCWLVSVLLFARPRCLIVKYILNSSRDFNRLVISRIKDFSPSGLSPSPLIILKPDWSSTRITKKF